MCGIIGYVGKKPAKDILIDGLAKLEYRGYDSAGIALLNDDDTLTIKKKAGRVEDLREMCSDDSPCLLYTYPSPRDVEESRMPSSA